MAALPTPPTDVKVGLENREAEKVQRIGHKHDLKFRTQDIRLDENLTFADLGLNDVLIKGLSRSGFEKPSPIQLSAIPYGRCGLDLVVQAKSGTGKTCVFSIIALESINLSVKSPQVLVLAPTREIALQIEEVMRGLGSEMKGLVCHSAIGGLSFKGDKEKVKNSHIVIGTPGRVKHLMTADVLDTSSIRLFILDEADKLLEDSFQEQINWVYSGLPESKQLVAASATYTEDLVQHLCNYMHNPTFVRLNSNDPVLIGVRQYKKLVEAGQQPKDSYNHKVNALIHILSQLNFQQCLVFSNLITRAENLSKLMESRGWPTTHIAGSQEQEDRIKAITKLKSYDCRILVSTDLTSRGIDADRIDLVINLDLPYDHETYLHRVGRAGRFGAKGAAITLHTPAESLKLNKIAEQINTTIQVLPDKLEIDFIENPLEPDGVEKKVVEVESFQIFNDNSPYSSAGNGEFTASIHVTTNVNDGASSHNSSGNGGTISIKDPSTSGTSHRLMSDSSRRRDSVISEANSGTEKGALPAVESPSNSGTEKGALPAVESPSNSGTETQRPAVESPSNSGTEKGALPAVESPSNSGTEKGALSAVESPSNSGTETQLPAVESPSKQNNVTPDESNCIRNVRDFIGVVKEKAMSPTNSPNQDEQVGSKIATTDHSADVKYSSNAQTVTTKPLINEQADNAHSTNDQPGNNEHSTNDQVGNSEHSANDPAGNNEHSANNQVGKSEHSTNDQAGNNEHSTNDYTSNGEPLTKDQTEPSVTNESANSEDSPYGTLSSNNVDTITRRPDANLGERESTTVGTEQVSTHHPPFQCLRDAMNFLQAPDKYRYLLETTRYGTRKSDGGVAKTKEATSSNIVKQTQSNIKEPQTNIKEPQTNIKAPRTDSLSSLVKRIQSEALEGDGSTSIEARLTSEVNYGLDCRPKLSGNRSLMAVNGSIGSESIPEHIPFNGHAESAYQLGNSSSDQCYKGDYSNKYDSSLHQSGKSRSHEQYFRQQNDDTDNYYYTGDADYNYSSHAYDHVSNTAPHYSQYSNGHHCHRHGYRYDGHRHGHTRPHNHGFGYRDRARQTSASSAMYEDRLRHTLDIHCRQVYLQHSYITGMARKS